METYTLGMSDAAWDAIQSGRASRKGGVVYWDDGGILEHLRDANVQAGSDPVKALCGASIVPLAALGVSFLAFNGKLSEIQDSLRQMQSSLDEISALTSLVNVQEMGATIGELNGQLYGCHLAISEGRLADLVNHRDDFVKTYFSLKYVVMSIVNSDKLMRRFQGIFSQYANAMFLAGLAARDISYHMGMEAAALELADVIAADAKLLNGSLSTTLRAPSALFWRQPSHVRVALDIKEAAERIESHAVAMRVLPPHEVRGVVSTQVGA